MKFYITTPIYYVNARPHIGHAYTTLAADVLARWRAMGGEPVFFLTGTDEHGAKVAQAAESAGKSPKKLADEVSQEFKETWKNLNLDYSDFIRTTDKRHEKGVARFMNLLRDRGALYESEYSGLYCTGCENFITEKDLADGMCPDHKKAPEKVAEKNWFFKLSEYTEKIKRLIEADEIKVRPEFAKSETLGLFQQGLEDFSVSREKVEWGIPLPWDKSQTVYVWVDALQNYITASRWNKENAPWPADVHLIGKDIIKFHCVYWPAMLLAAGFDLPKQIFVHGYFTIDGQKMSKSLGNVIDPNDLVSEFGSDGARYLLLSQFPFGQDGDIKAEEFDAQYNADLANGFGNLVSRVVSTAQKNNVSLVKSRDIFNVGGMWQEVERQYDNFALEEVLKTARKLANQSDKMVEEEKIWELGKESGDSAGKVFYTLLENIRHISLILRPFMPDTSDKIFEILGIPKEGEKDFARARKWGGLPINTSVKKTDPLFPRKN